MKNEWFGAVAVCALFAVLSLFCREKYVKTAMGVLLLTVWITPLIAAVGAVGKGATVPQLPSDLPQKATSQTVEEAFRDGIRRTVAGEFGLSEEDISVITVGFDASSLRAEKVRVILHGRAALADGYAIARRLTEGGVGETEAEIGIGR